MILKEYDTIHKIVIITTDKEELIKIARFLSGLGSKWTDLAKEKAKQKAIELTEIIEQIQIEELRQTREDLKDLKRYV